MIKIEQVFLHAILKALGDYLTIYSNTLGITLTPTAIVLGLITRVIILTQFRVNFNVLLRKSWNYLNQISLFTANVVICKSMGQLH